MEPIKSQERYFPHRKLTFSIIPPTTGEPNAPTRLLINITVPTDAAASATISVK